MSEDRLRAAAEFMMDALNRHDWETVASVIVPEFEYCPVEESVSYRGPEAFVEYQQQLLRAWDHYCQRLEELQLSADATRAFVAIHLEGKGKTSQVDVSAEMFHVWELQDLSVLRVVEYANRAEALAAFHGGS
jgi:ketosteroid isomerase-like protein